MGNSNGKIYGVIDLETDVYKVLGLGGLPDVGTACGSEKINKWSKRKPVRYNTPEELTDAQFKGTVADNGAGIFYGLVCGSEAGMLQDLHERDWEYLRVRPGTDWCRLTDFDGYDHNAVCTLEGQVLAGTDEESFIYYNLDKSLVAAVQYDRSGQNTTGVDIADIIPGGSDITIGDYYPCVLVGNYARAMANWNLSGGSVAAGEELVFTPLQYNGAWYTRFFAPELAAVPGMAEGEVLPVTVFLVSSIFQANLVNLRDSWVDVRGAMWALNFFTVPGAVGVSVRFEYYRDYVPCEVTSVSAYRITDGSGGISLGYDFPDGEPTEATTYSIVLRLPREKSKEFTFTPTGGIQLRSVLFSWEELGMLVMAGAVLDEVSGNVLYDGEIISNFRFTDVEVTGFGNIG